MSASDEGRFTTVAWSGLPADLIDGVGEPVGAATALAEMQRSTINLFI